MTYTLPGVIDFQDPHRSQGVLHVGPAIEKAAAVLLLVHGRGATAESMMSIYDALQLSSVAALAPQASGHTWYPQSFLAPISANQPYLDSALSRLDSIVTDLLSRGVPSEKIALLGFSQGACLASEYVARHPRHYGGLMALTGGLIGPMGLQRNDAGDLSGTRVFLGTSDPDPHVPYRRVEETRDVLTRMGALVELRRYPGMSHTINSDEISACRVLMEAIIK